MGQRVGKWKARDWFGVIWAYTGTLPKLLLWDLAQLFSSRSISAPLGDIRQCLVTYLVIVTG